jgi:hypothetical protein
VNRYSFAIWAFSLTAFAGSLHAQAPLAPPAAPSPIAIDGVIQDGDWRLPDGHYVSARMPMTLVHPRPDPETNPWARHKHAYPGIEYRIPVAVQGGAYPFFYEVLEGPAGMTVGQQYGLPDYGELTWTPINQNGVHKVRIRVTDQDFTQVETQFEITVGTENFVFVDANAARSGDGTIGSPLKSFRELHGRTGSSYPVTPHAGKVAYLRGGVYFVDDTPVPEILFQGSHTPGSVLGYPGESAVLDLINGKMTLREHDIFFGSIRFKENPDLGLLDPLINWDTSSGTRLRFHEGWPSLSNASRMFQPTTTFARLTFFDVKLTDFTTPRFNNGPGLKDSGNNGGLHIGAKSHGSDRYSQYHTYWRIVTDNMTGRAFGSLYGTQYGVLEASVHGPAAGRLIDLKEQNDLWSFRRNIAIEPDYSPGDEFLYQKMSTRRYSTPQRVEFCYNIAHARNGGSVFGTSSTADSNDDIPAGTASFIYRNTIIGNVSGQANKRYLLQFQNNVWIRDGAHHPSSGPERTVEVIDDLTGSATDLPRMLDENYALKGEFRDKYLGKRGHEIAAPL